MTEKKDSILIVDDQPEILNTMKHIFRRDYDVLTAESGREALEHLKERDVAVILADQRMPVMDGVTFLSEAIKIQPEAVRIMITGYADIEASINAVNQAQIYQYISKPFEPDELKLAVRRAVERFRLSARNTQLQEQLLRANRQLASENVELQKQVEKQLDLGNFIGHSPKMLKIFKLVRKVVETPTTVLILGETGTGKELLAKMIHYNSNRKDNIFVAQNCGAIPDTLLQSELFGHVKGAFTGAIQDKKGLFETADKGTVFLDEIGDTTPALQLGLLRVLQEGEIKPVGASKTKKVDVRIVAATNRDLRKDVQDGRFREDLFYRLSVFPLILPPLSERKQDIPELISHFLQKYTRRIGKEIERMDEEVIQILTNADYPGNIRELENEIERLVTLADQHGVISADMLSVRFQNTEISTGFSLQKNHNLKEAVADLERTMITNTLREMNGNIQQSAMVLGISRVGLHKMLKRYGIEAGPFKNNPEKS
ncbi:MAG: sigma-54-dependent transcriptional regulator [Calditrichaceae bacterium]